MWKKIVCLFLILSFIITIVGCGGVPTTPPINLELVLVRVTDPESNLIFVAGKENEDAMAILGEKNTEGNPTGITGAVYVSEQGDSFGIDAGIDGLPTYLIDSEGNKVIFENYTNSTVDISIYDSSGSLIQDTTTINVDPADLLELKQLYNSFYSKQRWSNENTVFVLKWGAISLSWVGCISSGGLTVFSGGVLTPVAAFACGRATLSTIAAFTPNDIDNAFSMGIGAGSCLISGGGCESIALSIIAWAIEYGGTTPDEIPNISGNWSGNYSSNLISGYINFVNITQSGTSFSGTYNDSLGTTGIISGGYDGNAFNFTMTQTNYDCSGSFSGIAYLNSDTLTFTFTGYNCLGTHENGVGSVTR